MWQKWPVQHFWDPTLGCSGVKILFQVSELCRNHGNHNNNKEKTSDFSEPNRFNFPYIFSHRYTITPEIKPQWIIIIIKYDNIYCIYKYNVYCYNVYTAFIVIKAHMKVWYSVSSPQSVTENKSWMWQNFSSCIQFSLSPLCIFSVFILLSMCYFDKINIPNNNYQKNWTSKFDFSFTFLALRIFTTRTKSNNRMLKVTREYFSRWLRPVNT